MPKQLLEINKFFNGTITTPDTSDTPEESASYSLNIDAVIKDGSLQSVPKNRIKYIYNSSGTAGGEVVDIDKIALIRSDGKTDAVYWDDTAKKLHFIAEIDKNSTLGSADYVNQIATTDSTLDTISDFSANSGISAPGVELKDVAMQPHSRELHVGLGITDGARPKWIGYANHKQFGSALANVIVEDAEVKYPSAVPFLVKTVVIGSYAYGVEKGGDRVWKINATTGAHDSSSDAGTFENLQSICTDGTNLFVLDRANSGSYKGVIYQIAPAALNTKAKVIGLPTTYPGPTGSQYSDIEYTSTGTKIWVAAHFDNRINPGTTSSASKANEKFLWNFAVPGSSSSTVTLDARMPRLSGGNNSTVGTWIQVGVEEGEAVGSASFTATENYILETFPRSLIKYSGENGAIYWMARYQDVTIDYQDGVFEQVWLNADASSATNSGTDAEDWAAKVAAYTEIRTLCLNRIAHDHTSGNSVPLTMIDHPNNAAGSSSGWSSYEYDTNPSNTACGIDSGTLDPDNKLHLSTGSTLERYGTAVDNTFTSLSSTGNTKTLGTKYATTYKVTPTNQEQRTGVSVNLGHNISNDIAMLRASGTAGLDKIAKAFSANATQTHLIDHSIVSCTPSADTGNTGSHLASYEYFYKLTFLFDGYQETNLSTEMFSYTQSNNQDQVSLAFTIADTSQLPRRATDLLIYRAESPTASATKPDSLYRLVKQIPLDTVWTTSTTGNVTSATLTQGDNGFKGVSYEANSELPQDLTDTMPQYSVSAQLNNYHFIGKCKHPKIDDATTYVFRSKVSKFDTFDWLLDYVKLPTVPTALISFNGRLWAFDAANTYKIEPNNMFIEDIHEGVGCLNDDAIVSTDFGMYFADDKNIYHLTSNMAEPIGESIVRGSDAAGTGNDITAWQNRDKTYHTRAVYDSTRRSVYFSFKGTDNKYYIWAWNIPRKRWDLFSFDDDISTLQPKGVCTIDSGEIFWGSDDSTTTIDGNGDSTTSTSKQKLKHFLGKDGATTDFYRPWTWVSKSLTMGNDTQQKKFKTFLIPYAASNKRIYYNKTTDGSFPSKASSLITNGDKKGTFREVINLKDTEIRVRLDSNTNIDTCGALGILYKTKRTPK